MPGIDDDAYISDHLHARGFELGGRMALSILVVLTLLYMVNYMDRSLLSIVLERMKLDLVLSDAQAGSLQSFFLLGVGIFMLPSAMVVDRWSRRKAVGLMAIIWSIGTFTVGLGSNYAQVAASLVLVGLGEAGFVAGGLAWISAVFSSEKRSKMLGVFNVGIPLGGALGALLGGLIATRSDSWRTPYLFFAIPGIILGITCFFLYDYATVRRKGEKALSREYLQELLGFFRIKSFVYATVGFGFWMMVLMSLIVWLPTLLIRTYGYTEEKAGAIASVVLIMAIVGAPLGGHLADKWQSRDRRGRMLLAAASMVMATAALGLMLMVINTSIWVVIAVGLLYGILTVAGIPALMSVFVDVVITRLRGSATGVSGLVVFGLFASLGPFLTGRFSDALGGGPAGLRNALLIMLPAGLIAALVTYLGSRHYPADTHSARGKELEEKESLGRAGPGKGVEDIPAESSE